MNHLEQWLQRNLPVAHSIPVESLVRQTLWAGFCEGLRHAEENVCFTRGNTPDLKPPRPFQDHGKGI